MKIVIECAPKMNGSFVKESGISCVGILKAYTSRCEKNKWDVKSEGMQSSKSLWRAATTPIHLRECCVCSAPMQKWAQCPQQNGPILN